MSGQLAAFDTIAALEVGRFRQDAARVRRMDKRAEDIRTTPGSSPLKLALLQARQFVDEFS